jgi:hypothetical protein
MPPIKPPNSSRSKVQNFGSVAFRFVLARLVRTAKSSLEATHQHFDI